MLTLLLVIAVGVAVLVVTEFVRRRLKIPNEDSRKIYHVVHALIISASPFLVSYNVIIGLEVLLLVNMLAVRRYNLFPWLYRVGRISWGEFFGVAGVIVMALMKPNKWVFLAAMLHFGLADALAAVIGKRYGKKYEFKVFGQTKSIPGSAAFYLTSLAITTGLVVLYPTGASLAIVMFMPPLITLAETASPFGTDNFVIPVLVVLVLNGLRFTP